MAFDFIKQLHQTTLEKAWNARPARPAKDPMPKRRQAVVDRINHALKQLREGEAKPPRGLYQTKEGVAAVRVTLKYGQRPLVIDGRDHWFVEDAAKFFSNAKRAAERGELDSAINAALEGKAGGQRRQRSTAGKAMSPTTVYGRNIKKYGQARADELLDEKYGKAEAERIRTGTAEAA